MTAAWGCFMSASASKQGAAHGTCSIWDSRPADSGKAAERADSAGAQLASAVGACRLSARAANSSLKSSEVESRRVCTRRSRTATDTVKVLGNTPAGDRRASRKSRKGPCKPASADTSPASTPARAASHQSAPASLASASVRAPRTQTSKTRERALAGSGSCAAICRAAQSPAPDSRPAHCARNSRSGAASGTAPFSATFQMALAAATARSPSTAWTHSAHAMAAMPTFGAGVSGFTKWRAQV